MDDNTAHVLLSLLNLCAILGGSALAIWRMNVAIKAASAAKILAQANAIKAAKTAEKVDQIKQDVAANTALTEQTHDIINSRMDELLKAKAAASHAEGVEEERDRAADEKGC